MVHIIRKYVVLGSMLLDCTGPHALSNLVSSERADLASASSVQGAPAPPKVPMFGTDLLQGA